jgi:predicted metal-dependent hydrolase
MLQDQKIFKIDDLEFRVIYSRRRTIGISVHPDSSVIVRVPYLTSQKTIARIVKEKYDWAVKHRDNYRRLNNNNLKRSYTNGETHLFRGNNSSLEIEKSVKSYVSFFNGTIQIGIDRAENSVAVKKVLYNGYKNEALKHFPELMNKVLRENEDQGFKPKGLIVRTMKRRWGSCSNKGIITLSTELIKLSDIYIEYVILHELCHLKHHNHGPKFYELLTEVFPDWKPVRKELKKYIQL